jgi:hypothetical protein
MPGNDVEVIATRLSYEAIHLRARRRLAISFSQGVEWKALISTYIGTIPLSGDAAEQSMSPPRTPVSSAIIAKVGAAARLSQSAMHPSIFRVFQF